MECHRICQTLDEFIKSRSLHLNQIVIWTSICKSYAAKTLFKYEFFMFCASLYEWMAQTRGFVYYTLTEACETLAVFSASAVSLNEDIHTCTTSPELFWESLYEHFTISFERNYIIYTQKLKRYSRQPVQIKVWFNLKTLCQKYISLLLFSRIYYY